MPQGLGASRWAPQDVNTPSPAPDPSKKSTDPNTNNTPFRTETTSDTPPPTASCPSLSNPNSPSDDRPAVSQGQKTGQWAAYGTTKFPTPSFSSAFGRLTDAAIQSTDTNVDVNASEPKLKKAAMRIVGLASRAKCTFDDAIPSIPVDTTTRQTQSSTAATFRIPTQGSLSNTDFYFLMLKLRGREISMQEWDRAVRLIQRTSFGKTIEELGQEGVAEGEGPNVQGGLNEAGTTVQQVGGQVGRNEEGEGHGSEDEAWHDAEEGRARESLGGISDELEEEEL